MNSDIRELHLKAHYIPATWVYVENKPDRLLLLKRPDGKFCVPGGNINPNESILNAAKRYAREQAGIETEGGIGILPGLSNPRYISRPGVSGIVYRGILFMVFDNGTANADRAAKVNYVSGDLHGNPKYGEPLWIPKSQFEDIDLTPGSGLLREILKNPNAGNPLDGSDIKLYLDGFVLP